MSDNNSYILALRIPAVLAEQSRRRSRQSYLDANGNPEILLMLVSYLTSQYQGLVFRDLNTYDYDPEVMAKNILIHDYPVGNIGEYLKNSDLSLKLLLTLKTILVILDPNSKNFKPIVGSISGFIRRIDQKELDQDIASALLEITSILPTKTPHNAPTGQIQYQAHITDR